MPQIPLLNLNDSAGGGGAGAAVERRLSSGRKNMTAASSASEDESTAPTASIPIPGSHPPSSPSRLPSSLPLSAISESGSGDGDDYESDASSIRDDNEGDVEQQQGLSRLRTTSTTEAGAEVDEAPVKSGYLMKKGERRKAWKKRWFVLRGGQLAMYKTDKEYQLLRLIPLSTIHTCAPVELKKHSYTFGLVTPKRTYYIKAGSASERDSWCETVERAKKEAAEIVTEVPTPGSSTPIAIPSPAATRTPTAAHPRSPQPQSHSISPTSFPPARPATSSSLPRPVPPPNSFAAGGGVKENSLQLGGVDEGLTRYARGSSGSEGLAVPTGEYFAAHASGSGGGLMTPNSPGIVSSSEEEDDYAPENEGDKSAATESGLRFVEEKKSAMPVDPNKVILQGYLMKQGKRKNWRKRWFILTSHKLSYSRSHMDAKVHRQIPLSSVLDAIENQPAPSPASSDPNTAQHSFKIITPKRTFLVCAPSEEDEIKWLAALQCLVMRRPSVTSGMPAGVATNVNGGVVVSGAGPGGNGGNGGTGAQMARKGSRASNAGLGVSSPPAPSGMVAGEEIVAGGGAPPPMHGRQRSVTDAARAAVKEGVASYRGRTAGVKV
ncbi:pleckstrin-like domain-containing protein [Pseudohyphozyma bogoriensis]|nr:pleckstrin-like domain-containing protein [Pseudohyphozyma bogoriensis]